MSEHDAVRQFVADGDYFAYDCNYFQRGPSSLIREVIRQRKKISGCAASSPMLLRRCLVEGGCASKLDVAFVGFGPWLSKAVAEGRLKTYDIPMWS